MSAIARPPGALLVCRCGAELERCGTDGATAYLTCATCGAWVQLVTTATEEPGLFDDRDYAAGAGKQTDLF